jgi:hypothetical protein
MEKWNVIYASLCHKIQGCLKSSSHVGHGRLQADCCDFVAGKSIFGVCWMIGVATAVCPSSVTKDCFVF